VPLGRHYYPIFSLLNSAHGLVALPFDRFELVYPAVWKKFATDILLAGERVVPEFRTLRSVLPEVTRGAILDVGANIGVYTLLIRAVSNLRIIAYEPQPFLCDLLQRTISHNHMQQVEARNLACGEKPGEVPFYAGLNGNIAHGEDARGIEATASGQGTRAVDDTAREMRAGKMVIRVPVVTLDDDLRDTAVGLMKIDCEGFECQVLRGAKRILQQQRPWLFIEVHPFGIERYGGSVKEVLELIGPNYDIECWDFNAGAARTKLGRSLKKHRKVEGRKFTDVAEMLRLCAGQPPWPQPIHLLCRPHARV
jgi:FkbM family methyltransferase